jgi:hypothetical protein
VRLLADLVVVLHLAFILFASLGGLLVFKWPRVAWVHAPAVVWGVFIELTGRVCPLTPIERSLREAAGQEGYQGDFVEHYIIPIVYPPALTFDIQVALGVFLLGLNAVIYAWLWRRATPSRAATR